MAPKREQSARSSRSCSSYATYSSTDHIFSDGYSSDPDTVSSHPAAAAVRNFPAVVISRILFRLPVKSVLRFTCVSKEWRTLVSLPDFISQHLARSPASLLIHARPVAGGEIQPQQQPGGHAIYAYHGPPGEQSTVNRILHFPGHGYNQLNIIGSTPNGVVCIVQQPNAQSFTLWNPATRSSLRISAGPDPKVIAAASGGFGFDPSRNEYMLFRILRFVPDPGRVPDMAMVFNFRTYRWVRLVNGMKGNVRFRFTKVACEAVVKGVPYWSAWDVDPVMGPRLVLAWFDSKRSDFTVELFGWEAEKRKMILGEIREGYLGAIVWDVAGPAEEGAHPPRAFNVWVRPHAHALGAWMPLYRVDHVGPPPAADIVGFYALDRSSGIVQRIVDDDHENNGNGMPYLRIIKYNGDNVAFEDYFCLDGSMPVTFSPVLRYRESLARLPVIRGAVRVI